MSRMKWRSNRWCRVAAVLAVMFAVAGPFLGLFGPVLLSDKTFAFRDAVHFYRPMFQWTSGEWAAGRVPLWNPQESCGTPEMADTTSSVFYPGQLIFAMPALAYETKYELYIVLHFLLAAAGAYLAARRFRASMCGAGACAISYALGGNVLFQYCNVEFLIGAAWLPFAMFAAERMMARRSWRWAVALGAVLGLMTLGGDPHMAYHAGLLAALYAYLRRRFERKQRAVATQNDGDSYSLRDRIWTRVVTSAPALLSIAAISGGLLAAIQILSAMECSQRSDRAAFDSPRSIYESAEFLARRSHQNRENRWREITIGLTGQPRPDTHEQRIYEFSVGTWRLAELVWPNCCGRMLSTNRRWFNVNPNEGRT